MIKRCHIGNESLVGKFRANMRCPGLAELGAEARVFGKTGQLFRKCMYIVAFYQQPCAFIQHYRLNTTDPSTNHRAA